MKKLGSLIILCFAIGITHVQSQDCTFYFPQKPGTQLVQTHYKAGDVVSGTSKTKVLEQTGSSIKFSSEFSDKDGKVLSSGDYEVKCKNGEFVMDMSGFKNNMNLAAFKNMDVKFDASEMTLPSNLQPGQSLNDGLITITIANQQTTIMTMTTKITNRKVEAIQDVTTPAGTFSCVKITYDIETHSMMTIHSKGVQFVSKTAGIVRNESYNSEGKLQSYSVLTSITQ